MSDENTLEDENEEMGVMLKAEVNHLAALFYQMNGRVFMPDYDFSEANHGEEKGCWNKACVAFAVLRKDNWFLQFQVK